MVVIYANNETGVENVINTEKLKLYPNPGNGSFSVEFDFALKSNALAKIIDLKGRTVYETNINNLNASKLDFNVSNLKSGNYYFVLTNGQERFVKTLIIY